MSHDEVFFMPLSLDDTNFFKKLDIVFSIPSIACSLGIIAVITLIHMYDAKLADRVSLRLTFYVSIADLVYSVFQVFSYVIEQPGFWCSFSVWGYVNFSLLSVYLKGLIAFSLQLIFVHQIKDTKRYEAWYIVGAIIGSFIPATAPALAGMYGWLEWEHTCWYLNDGLFDGYVWEWLSYYIWVLMSVIYSTFTIVIVLKKIYTRTREIELEFEGGKKVAFSSIAQRNAFEAIKQAAYRVAWYPIISLFTRFFELLNAVYTYHQGEFPYWVNVGGVITAASPGTITAIVFLFDPSLKHAWLKICEGMVKEYGTLSQHSEYSGPPPFSPISPGFTPTQHLLSPSVCSDTPITQKASIRQQLIRWAVRKWLLPHDK
ncbi:hypothetical protein K493DRAFT_305621 [Basidiobolus meristosporus CBS 931.73]|uniref:G-protein coupled receptors family 2 profile 2 domain-containing protein n=1 Tax=Basidiobolus meristosporus CBS 931.73 TaxID=1314790 RepID=A0A1Y1XV18_9FUNG|nr:hypothetical protein K493DRAFT_305621 [Basidiobolus meristosporus CBS 931.73]|eukprot:ORX89612.1 hypothetical protein K493DRAFT_305621 [Basidiobolus meristosporus CBS 931.73]